MWKLVARGYGRGGGGLAHVLVLRCCCCPLDTRSTKEHPSSCAYQVRTFEEQRQHSLPWVADRHKGLRTRNMSLPRHFCVGQSTERGLQYRNRCRAGVCHR